MARTRPSFSQTRVRATSGNSSSTARSRLSQARASAVAVLVAVEQGVAGVEVGGAVFPQGDARRGLRRPAGADEAHGRFLVALQTLRSVDAAEVEDAGHDAGLADALDPVPFGGQLLHHQRRAVAGLERQKREIIAVLPVQLDGGPDDLEGQALPEVFLPDDEEAAVDRAADAAPEMEFLGKVGQEGDDLAVLVSGQEVVLLGFRDAVEEVAEEGRPVEIGERGSPYSSRHEAWAIRSSPS